MSRKIVEGNSLNIDKQKIKDDLDMKEDIDRVLNFIIMLIGYIFIASGLSSIALLVIKIIFFIINGYWVGSVCDILLEINFRKDALCKPDIYYPVKKVELLFRDILNEPNIIIYLTVICGLSFFAMWVGSKISVEIRRAYGKRIAIRHAKAANTFDTPMTAIDAYIREELAKREEFIKLVDGGMTIERHDTEEYILFLPSHTSIRRELFKKHEDYLPVNARRDPVTDRIPRSVAPVLFHWKGDTRPLLSFCVFADNSIMIDTGQYGWKPELIWDPDFAVDIVLQTIEGIFANEEADRRDAEEIKAKESERKRQVEQHVHQVKADRLEEDSDAVARLRARKRP